MTAVTLTSERVTLRPWTLDDAEDALAIYGQEDVARWLSPAMDRVHDPRAMRILLQHWINDNERGPVPTGRWAIELTAEHRVIGGAAILPLPPDAVDLEIGWQLAPDYWGQGFGTEAGRTLAAWALRQDGVDEIFAVVRPKNERAAALARRLGMEWVGETDKYYNLRLQVYRLRTGDLDTRWSAPH